MIVTFARDAEHPHTATQRTLRRLLRAVNELVEAGVCPPVVDPAHQKVRSAAIVLPPEVPFTEGAREALIADPALAPASV